MVSRFGGLWAFGFNGDGHVFHVYFCFLRTHTHTSIVMHHTFTRPFDLSEGNAACILPWQRDQIRRDCGGISAAVRSRPSYGDTKKLTLVGQTSLLDAEFDRAEAQARAHIASNFVKGVTCVGDHPASTKPEVAQKKAKTEADASTLSMMQQQHMQMMMLMMNQMTHQTMLQSVALAQPVVPASAEPLKVAVPIQMGYGGGTELLRPRIVRGNIRGADTEGRCRGRYGADTGAGTEGRCRGL